MLKTLQGYLYATFRQLLLEAEEVAEDVLTLLNRCRVKIPAANKMLNSSRDNTHLDAIPTPHQISPAIQYYDSEREL